jgi:hypothetical protein
MNAVLKAILQGVETVGVQVAGAQLGPAPAMIDGAIHRIVEHKGDDVESSIDAATAALQLVERIHGADVADEVQFRAGLLMAEAAFKQIRASLKHTAAPVAPVG